MSQENFNNIMSFGLLHVAKGEKNAINLSVSDVENQILIYLKCAHNLAKSLKNSEINFKLITNNSLLITSMCKKHRLELDLVEIDFELNVPKGIDFYSAHYKIDVFKYLSIQKYQYMIFLDLDILAINTLPPAMRYAIAEGVNLAYDITDQVVPDNGVQVIIKDIEKLTGRSNIGRWYGGEFLGGGSSFFKDLHHEILNLCSSYFSNINHFHHVGDEMLTTAAIDNLSNKGVKIQDAGKLGLIHRVWSGKCNHYQKSVKSYKNYFLLHFPNDKLFVANVKVTEQVFSDYLKWYRRPYLAGKRVLSNLRLV